jgi:hypothetical protein
MLPMHRALVPCSRGAGMHRFALGMDRVLYDYGVREAECALNRVEK